MTSVLGDLIREATKTLRKINELLDLAIDQEKRDK